jgi:hypothetical protein
MQPIEKGWEFSLMYFLLVCNIRPSYLSFGWNWNELWMVQCLPTSLRLLRLLLVYP